MKRGTNRSEQALVKQMGGTPHRNSGRGMKKGDATYKNFIVDIKERGKSFTLNTDAWAKICTDAARVDMTKDPALIIVFNDKTKLAVIALDVLERLIDGS